MNKREPEYLYTGTGERVPRRHGKVVSLFILALVAGIAFGQWWEKHYGPDMVAITEAVKAKTASYDRLQAELANVAGVCSMDAQP